MRPQRAEGNGKWADLAPLVIALGSILSWLVVISLTQPEPIGDEKYHLQAVRLAARGQWSALGFITVLPIYHVGAALVTHIFGETLLAVRAYSAVLAMVATALIHFAARGPAARGRQGSGASAAGDGARRYAALLFAWNPLVLPFVTLVYTEAAALLALAAALLLRVHRRRIGCAVALLIAGLIRQSTCVWLVFFAVWEAAEVRFGEVPEPLTHANLSAERAPARRWRNILGAIWPYACAGGIFAVVLAFAWPRLVGSDQSNRIQINVAQFYMFGIVAALLWAPLWVEQAARLWRARFQPALAHAWVCAAALAAVGLLEVAFRNPHPWNVDPNFLRDRVLMWMAESLPARLVVGAGLVALVPLVVAYVAGQRHGRSAQSSGLADWRALTLAWIFAVAFITPHWLVDPRYYAIPAVIINYLGGYTAAQALRLVAWHLALSLPLLSVIAACNRML